jgi:putative transposase
MLANTPAHIIQRGNNRQACFFHDEDYQFYLDWLSEYAEEYGCSVHAYVLMTNHVHLLMTGETADSIALLMKRLGQRYVQYVNRTYKRSGTLWEGRFKSCLTQAEEYVLACYRYIELNPVRAGMVEYPGDYPWSSFGFNGTNESSDLITQHESYIRLDVDPEIRYKTYRELFRYQLEPGLIDQIRSATNGNVVLGHDRFAEQVENALGRRVTKGYPGRPRKDK